MYNYFPKAGPLYMRVGPVTNELRKVHDAGQRLEAGDTQMVRGGLGSLDHKMGRALSGDPRENARGLHEA